MTPSNVNLTNTFFGVIIKRWSVPLRRRPGSSGAAVALSSTADSTCRRCRTDWAADLKISLSSRLISDTRTGSVKSPSLSSTELTWPSRSSPSSSFPSINTAAVVPAWASSNPPTVFPLLTIRRPLSIHRRTSPIDHHHRESLAITRTGFTRRKRWRGHRAWSSSTSYSVCLHHAGNVSPTITFTGLP